MSIESVGAELGGFLSYLTRRQEVVASNIANADTPGYKTQDLDSPPDFSSLLQQSSRTTVDAPGLTARNDGNNVSIDRESRQLAENDLRFSLASQLIRSQIKNVRSAIEEGRSA